MRDLNEQEIMNRVENSIERMRGLKCSLKSKVYLINTKIISPIIYLSSSHIISKLNLNKIDQYILQFFWDHKPAKIKNKVIMNKVEYGGLKVPCFSLKYLALRGFWIKEGLTNTIQLWKEFVHHESGFSIKDLIVSGSGLNTFKSISLFYREILEIAKGLINNNDSDLLIIENQRININENLVVNGGVFTNVNFNNSELRDIIHTDGGIFTAKEIMDKFNINVLTANSLISCIPRSWKERLKKVKCRNDDNNIYMILKTRKPISRITCKLIYQYYLEIHAQRPNACTTWSRLSGIEIANTNWNFYFSIIKHMSFKQYYQMIQYKLIHRILNVNVYLEKCKIKNSKLCDVCKINEETIDHVFIDCSDRENFIIECKNWLDKITKINFQISNLEFLFGILNEGNDEYIDVYNRYFFVLKMYIWQCRNELSIPSLNCFINFLTNEIVYERECIRLKNKDIAKNLNLRWKDIITALNISID